MPPKARASTCKAAHATRGGDDCIGRCRPRCIHLTDKYRDRFWGYNNDPHKVGQDRKTGYEWGKKDVVITDPDMIILPRRWGRK